MPYQAGRRHFPAPEDRRQHLQVVNTYVQGQTDLTPVSQEPVQRVREGMAPLLSGQAVPLLGERVQRDVDPNLRDV
jgi:hypothetical protein